MPYQLKTPIVHYYSRSVVFTHTSQCNDLTFTLCNALN